MKKTLLALFVMVFAADINAQIINENFNSGIPGTWTVVDGGAPTGNPAKTWGGTTSGHMYFTLGPFYINGTSEYAIVESEGAGLINDDILETPAFNGTSYSTISLAFKQVWEVSGAASAERGYVDVWNGTSWNTVLTMNTNTFGKFLTGGAPIIDNQSGINLTAYKNANMKVRFRYNNNGTASRWWAIDDVVITGGAPVSPPVAAFSANKTSACTGETITFTDLSTNGPNQWTWTFTPSAGITYLGGTSANSQNPQVKFATATNYNVSLLALNNNGNDTELKNTYLSIVASPTSDAGSNQSMCSNNISAITLSGSITGAMGSSWSSSGSSGTITSPSSPSTTYNPSIPDVNSGSVILTLEATGSSCNVSDAITITFTDAPTANSGNDQDICEDGMATLTGSVTKAAGGKWISSGSAGTIASPSSLSTTYTPTVSDVSGGSVVLTFETTGVTGNCSSVTDDITITLSEKPTANAGPDLTICKGENVSLVGSITLAATSTWSSAGAGGFSSASSLSTSYNPTSTEDDAGIAILYLTSGDNGGCVGAIDSLEVTIKDTCGGVGINDITKLNTAIYPNPVLNNKLFIDLTDNLNYENMSISMTDILGKIVIFENKLINLKVNELNLEDLEEGLYFITIKENGNSIKNAKVLIK